MKYKKVVGYWVYTIYIPSIAKYYIGYSKLQCYDRWRKGCYKKNNSLGKYLHEWDNMVKTVIQDGLTKEEFREKRKKRERERYHKNMLNEGFREKERKRAKERRAKKKLEKQQQEPQLTLFDLAS